MACIGHVENFYHHLNTLDIKEEVLKTICKSVADCALNY